MQNIIKQNLKQIYDHANECYPSECCGFIHTNGEIVFAENIQDNLHKLDLITYPQTSKNGYSFSINDNRLLMNSFKSQNSVGTIFHSHPDVGAYFSAEDKHKALFKSLYSLVIKPRVCMASFKNGCLGRVLVLRA